MKEIAELIGCKFIGDENHPVTGLNEIHKVENGDLVFVDHPKYYSKALDSAATTILIDKEVECPEGLSLVMKTSNGVAMCLKADSALKMIDRGIVVPTI